MKFKIGMRNIKTALAVSLCVLISELLKLEYPFYAAIAAIISMGNSITNSFKVGKNRMMGTSVGAFIGLMFASIQPNNVLLCGLGIIVVIYICNLLKWNKSITIAGIVFMAIMVNLDGQSPIRYSVNRIIDTFIGISVALVVNYLFFPYDYKHKILKGYNTITSKASLIINQMICLGMNVDLGDLKREIGDLNKELDVCSTEYRLKKDENNKIKNMRRKIELYNDIYENLRMLQRMEEGRFLNDDNIVKLKRLNYFEFRNKGESCGDLNIVYNYHIGRIIEDLQSIQLCEA
ncbi:FUSC family protein [Crassaminicella profunda]|uniref:FUSC family protein n=1 Tax=Crassaminicella profunda TaxID=1286698 RepID=UPI001CA75D3A|nr:aromatic acid exporter family protein [Crassaminicella profunda]QZY54159.1 FUSC family protein [Crassaminicella profunda]